MLSVSATPSTVLATVLATAHRCAPAGVPERMISPRSITCKRSANAGTWVRIGAWRARSAGLIRRHHAPTRAQLLAAASWASGVPWRHAHFRYTGCAHQLAQHPARREVNIISAGSRGSAMDDASLAGPLHTDDSCTRDPCSLTMLYPRRPLKRTHLCSKSWTQQVRGSFYCSAPAEHSPVPAALFRASRARWRPRAGQVLAYSVPGSVSSILLPNGSSTKTRVEPGKGSSGLVA
jgi:hypothetical protein